METNNDELISVFGKEIRLIPTAQPGKEHDIPQREACRYYDYE
jgi:hypothetical protein